MQCVTETLTAFVVGYTTTNVESGKWYLVSLSFENVGATHQIRLQDIVTGNFTPGTSSSGASANTPELQIWNPEKGGVGDYDKYFFWKNSMPAGYSNYWAANNLKPNWGAAQNMTVSIGQGVWFKCYNDCTITCAGQVSAVTTDPITTKVDKWNLIANPFPTTLTLNSQVNWYAAGLRGGTSSSNAPEIQVWDPNKGGVGDYDKYWFWASSLPAGLSHFWAANNLKPNYKADLAVPVGRGFWLKYSKANSATGEDLTFTFEK